MRRIISTLALKMKRAGKYESEGIYLAKLKNGSSYSKMSSKDISLYCLSPRLPKSYEHIARSFMLFGLNAGSPAIKKFVTAVC